MLTILRSGQPTEIAAFVMAAGWAGFGVILVLGKRGAAKGSANRDLRSTFGFLLQLAAYAICFVFYRSYFSPIVPMSVSCRSDSRGGLDIALTLWSVWFCYAAARALGKQWALMARVIEGHELIRQGPFAIVRNPIYLAMLAHADRHRPGRQPLAGAGGCATVVFAVGTAIRIRTEEKLAARDLRSDLRRLRARRARLPAPLKWR